MLINFDNPQSPVIILIENGLDAGGFSGSRISEEEAVVGWFSCQEGLCIFNELILWNFIAYQVIQVDMGNFRNRHDFNLILCGFVFQTEGFVKPQLSHTVVLVKGNHVFQKFFRCDRICQKLA